MNQCCEKCRYIAEHFDETSEGLKRGEILHCRNVFCECHQPQTREVRFKHGLNRICATCLNQECTCPERNSDGSWTTTRGTTEPLPPQSETDSKGEPMKWESKFDEQWSDAADPTPNRKIRVKRLITNLLTQARKDVICEVEKALHHIPMLHQPESAYPVKDVLDSLNRLKQLSHEE